MNRPRICVSIVDNNPDSILKIENRVDFFELRLDLIGPEWPELVKYLKKPWIACNRSREEGGRGETNDSKRIEELLRASEAGAQIVDIEYNSKNLAEFVPLIKAGSKCLISFHDVEGTPSYDSLVEIAGNQIKAGADICKIITTARVFEDNLTVIKLIKRFPEANIVAFSMGEAGRISRILCPLAGGYFTYACLEKGLESASGQIPLDELIQYYECLRKND